jgi:hypothetical protein
MAIQFSDAVRNARLNAIEATIGASAILRIRTLTVPSNCAAADVGVVLATLNLPASWMLAASGGQVLKDTGAWQDLTADAAGTALHFRIYDTAGTVCGLQGIVSGTGGGGDLQLDNTSIAAGQSVTITAFTLTDANG